MRCPLWKWPFIHLFICFLSFFTYLLLNQIKINNFFSKNKKNPQISSKSIIQLTYHRPHVGRFTRKNTFNSIKLASIKNTAYISRHACPTFRSNLNLLSENATYNISSVDSSEMAEYSNPAEFIPTKWLPGLTGKNDAFMSHGKPKHSKMSNVFDPIELLMPIEPWPKNWKQRLIV